MTKVGSSLITPSLDEGWIVRVLQGTPITDSPHQLVVRLDDRRICLTVVAADHSEDGWLRYSEASARRVAASGDRLQPLLASGRTDDCFYVAYEVESAQPLSSQLAGPQVSGAQSLQLLHGIGRGLDQAAASSFYPAEVTPDSVFVDPSRGPVLVDLGVAREALGNPKFEDPRAPWVAPEVLRGEGAAERSTVYSLGALMYTLLTGRPPHEGTPEEIIAADPPALREVRPDLPEALEVVISTALARDPRRRYSTAAETRSLANILLQGDLVPDLEPQPAPPRPASVALTTRSPETVDAAETRSLDTADARWETALRRGSQAALAWAASTAQAAGRAASRGGTQAVRAGRAQAARLRQARIETAPRLSAGGWRPLALAAGVLVLGVLAGVLLAGGPDEPPPTKTFSRGGLEVRLPGDWKGTVPAAGALAAHPVGDPGSGLSLEQVDAPVELVEQGNPVRLGRLEAWREPRAEAAGARAAVRYVIPTESGKLVATCRAAPRAGPGTLEACERVASTLRLRSATGLPIAAVVAQQERWQTEVVLLGRERAAVRRNLARAELPAGQRAAAEALARVHIRAALRFASMPGGEAVAAAARRTAGSYRALARAADGESSLQFNAARVRVRDSEASLRRAIAEG